MEPPTDRPLLSPLTLRLTLQVPFGTPWTAIDADASGLVAGPPEAVARRLGFFVHRPETLRPLLFSPRVEVMRVRFASSPKEEEGAAWFYHCVGAGVFLNTSSSRISVWRATHKHAGGRTHPEPLPFDSEQLPRAGVAAASSAADVSKYGPTRPISAPRTELVLQHGLVGRFWPPASLFSLADGSPCEMTAEETGLLTCRQLRVRLWSASVLRLDRLQTDRSQQNSAAAVAVCDEREAAVRGRWFPPARAAVAAVEGRVAARAEAAPGAAETVEAWDSASAVLHQGRQSHFSHS